MNKKTRKAFTLVELLVVIAILAVLASVSIIGYTAFTKKAVENNARSELTQVKTLVTGGATTDEDGYIVYFNSFTAQAGGKVYAFSFDGENNVYKFTELTLVADDADTVNPDETKLNTIELTLTSEVKLNGSFEFNTASQTVTYTLENGSNKGVAEWSLLDDEVRIK